jgi:hypothetical protein
MYVTFRFVFVNFVTLYARICASEASLAKELGVA